MCRNALWTLLKKPDQEDPLESTVCAGGSFLVTSAAIWLKTGAHTGFSKNRVEIQMVDPITQIEYVEYEERFIMGIEYLAAGFFAGLACIAAGFFLGRRR